MPIGARNDELERLFRQHERGLRSSQEVVDCVLGLLAYEAAFESAEAIARWLLKRFGREVQQWIAIAEAAPQVGSHWMPYRDSRLVSAFHGGLAGGSFTAEEHQRFDHQMRFNVQEIARIVRALLS